MFNFILFFLIYIFFLYIQFKYEKPFPFNVSILYSVYWFLFLFCSYLLFFQEYSFNILSFYWILLCLILFYISFKVTKKIYLKKSIQLSRKNQNNLSSKYYELITNIIIICLIIKIIGDINFLYMNDFSFFNFFNIDDIKLMISRLIEIRYNIIEYERSFITPLGNTLFYFSILMFGFYYHYISKKKYIIFLLILSTFLAVFVSMGKSPVIYAIIIFISGYYVHLSNENISIIKNNKKIFIFIIGISIVMISVLVLITLFRKGTLSGIFDTIKLYAFGSVPAFDFYFTHMIPSEFSFGHYTFGVIYKYLGISSANPIQGVYLPIEVANLSTNVFTAFRCIIDDFGIYGGLLFHFILGTISGFITALINKKNSLIGYALLSIICVYILESFVISIATFSSIVFAYFLFFIFQIYSVFLNNKLTKYKDIREID